MRAKRALVIELDVGIVMTFVAGETGRDQGLFQLRNFGDVNRLPIQLRPFPRFGAEQFVTGGIINNGRDARRRTC